MAMVRYLVDDVDEALSFYCSQLGFHEVMHPAPAFALLQREDLRLALSAPGGGPGGGQAMADGTLPGPGGWNRFSLEVADLRATVDRLRAAGVRFRNDVVTGVGGLQILVEDPSGNAVELFEPTRPEARSGAGSTDERDRLQPVGRVVSELLDPLDAPRQGDEGAPDADIIVSDHAVPALDGLREGAEVIVLTWLHRARRDVLTVRPRGDRDRPETGVFATRSPDRPNPIGLHTVRILAIDGNRLRVAGLEAVDGTPVLDLKPVLEPPGQR